MPLAVGVSPWRSLRIAGGGWTNDHCHFQSWNYQLDVIQDKLGLLPAKLTFPEDNDCVAVNSNVLGSDIPCFPHLLVINLEHCFEELLHSSKAGRSSHEPDYRLKQLRHRVGKKELIRKGRENLCSVNRGIYDGRQRRAIIVEKT